MLNIAETVARQLIWWALLALLLGVFLEKKKRFVFAQYALLMIVAVSHTVLASYGKSSEYVATLFFSGAAFLMALRLPGKPEEKTEAYNGRSQL